MMHANAPHPNCAYLWMEWSLDPKVQGDLASWFGSVPAVPRGVRGQRAADREGCETNGIDNFDQIEFWKTPQADCFARTRRPCACRTTSGSRVRRGDRRPLSLVEAHGRRGWTRGSARGPRRAHPSQRSSGADEGPPLATRRSSTAIHGEARSCSCPASCGSSWSTSARSAMLVDSFWSLEEFTGLIAHVHALDIRQLL